jgi:nicotinamide-nucleotide adenylyltransferase
MTGEIGVIHGRFQVFHNDHLKYIMAGKERCTHLVVGITNPDPSLTREDAADPQRSLAVHNPLTYFERYTMVRGVLLEGGMEVKAFSIVPFPINLPDLYRYYLPIDAVFYLTIYDEWGQRKLEQFKALGLRTEVLWSRPSEEKGLKASDIRQKMIEGEPWQHLVPEATYRLMEEWSIPERLRKLNRK